MTNNHDTLHGAFQALLLDGYACPAVSQALVWGYANSLPSRLSTSAVAALAVGKTWESGGVSTDFQLRFLNPGTVGSRIRSVLIDPLNAAYADSQC